MDTDQNYDNVKLVIETYRDYTRLHNLANSLIEKEKLTSLTPQEEELLRQVLIICYEYEHQSVI